jgi:hypothetical protein
MRYRAIAEVYQMIQRHQNARKYFVEKYGMNENAPFVEVAKKVVDESNGKILFDSNKKRACGDFLYLVWIGEGRNQWV